jgi:hypothetical protein
MENKYPIWETTEYSDTQFEIGISIELLKNNLAQMLKDLINTYKFYYSGLEVTEDKYLQFKHTAEINFLNTERYPFDKVKNIAHSHLSKNYLKDIIEIVNFELIEVCKIIFLLNQRGKGYNKTTVDNILNDYKNDLNKKHFPELINIIEKEIGQLQYRIHILSINTIRKYLVHRNGLVDINSIELITSSLKVFTDKSYSDKNYKLKEEDIQHIDFKKEWKQNEYIFIEYDDCFRILFTVIFLFNDTVNKLIIRYPFLKDNSN